MEDFGIFYGHLVYFTAIWYIFCPFGIFCGNFLYFVAIWYIFIVIWYIFSRFGMLFKEKSGNPAVHANRISATLTFAFH
jgi:hypothetical protein